MVQGHGVSHTVRRKRLSRLIKISLWGLCGIAVLLVLTIPAASFLGKFLIEKYDERYLGREITLKWAYINPFTGFVQLNQVQVLEAGKDTVFFSARQVSADVAMLKLFSKTYEVSRLIIEEPRGTFVQRKKQLNFDDLIARFRPDTLNMKRAPLHLNILGISLRHGNFIYREKIIPIRYLVRDLNLESPGKRWDVDTLTTAFSVLSPDGKGEIKGNFMINVASLEYRAATVIRNFDLELARQYLWELINYGMFSARLDANITTRGNFHNTDDITVKGKISVSDFHLGKTSQEDYASFDRLAISMEEFSPIRNKFLFDSVTLIHPFVLYEKYDSLNNVERILGRNASNISDVTSQQGRFNLIIELGRYLKTLSRNFFHSQYRINSLSVTRANLDFNDFSLGEEFSIGVRNLTLRADSVNKTNPRVKARLHADIYPHGQLSFFFNINPLDSVDFDMTYQLTKVPATVFNPYLLSFTSFALDRGTIELNGVWNVRNGEVASKNHVLIIDPRTSGRLRNKDFKWIPLPLIFTIVRERGNVMDYEIPIRGNLRNPHFLVYDVVRDILRNIFIKPMTIPYGMEVKNSEAAIEEAVMVKWDRRQRLLKPEQRNVVSQMARFLEENGKATLAVHPVNYAQKERESVLFFEAKKKYFLRNRPPVNYSFSESDSVEVERMSIRDPAFLNLLKQGVSDTVLFTIQEKCGRYVGHGLVDKLCAQLVVDRTRDFESFFTRQDTRRRVVMHPVLTEIPYDGFSFLRIGYRGKWPEALRKASEDMQGYNEESLRKHYRRRK